MGKNNIFCCTTCGNNDLFIQYRTVERKDMTDYCSRCMQHDIGAFMSLEQSAHIKYTFDEKISYIKELNQYLQEDL